MDSYPSASPEAAVQTNTTESSVSALPTTSTFGSMDEKMTDEEGGHGLQIFTTPDNENIEVGVCCGNGELGWCTPSMLLRSSLVNESETDNLTTPVSASTIPSLETSKTSSFANDSARSKQTQHSQTPEDNDNSTETKPEARPRIDVALLARASSLTASNESTDIVNTLSEADTYKSNGFQDDSSKATGNASSASLSERILRTLTRSVGDSIDSVEATEMPSLNELTMAKGSGGSEESGACSNKSDGFQDDSSKATGNASSASLSERILRALTRSVGDSVDSVEATEMPSLNESTMTKGSGGSEESGNTSKGITSSSDSARESSVDSDSEGPEIKRTFHDQYASAIRIQHRIILGFLHWISRLSAQNPKRTIFITTVLSFALIIIGFETNFNIFTDENVMWVPQDSLSVAHNKWLNEEPKFPGGAPNRMPMLFHAEGGNIISKDSMSLVFDALETLYADALSNGICVGSLSNEPIPLVENACSVTGVTGFWNHSRTIFDEQVKNDFDLQVAMSALFFPDGSPVPIDLTVGYPVYDDETNLLVSAQSFLVLFNYYGGSDWELDGIKVVLALDDAWAADTNSTLRVEIQANSSLGSELARTIEEDIHLFPLVFIIMSVFTGLVFFKPHGVFSRSSLGVAAVVSILLSIMSGFGLLFIFGVPFTSITQLLPFLMFGIGLDDAFIIMGAYERTDKTMNPVDRISETVDKIGLSITLTTLTSALAFASGVLSSVPAINWLCLYAFPTILLVFLWQMSFFIACVVLDEHRIMTGHKDIWLCFRKAKDFNHFEESQDIGKHVADRIMGGYARLLLRPWVKIVTVVLFAVLFGLCCWRATLLEQKFKLTDVLPRDSYVSDFVAALESYRRSALTADVFFRDIDQSNKTVQAQMMDYLNELDQLDGAEKTGEFWLEHFNVFVDFAGANDLPFKQQLYLFFTNDIFRRLYFGSIALDGDGNIQASRAPIDITVDLDNVNEVIQFLKAQDKLSREFVGNQGRERYAFLTFNSFYMLWEFFAIAVDELILTTIVGIVAVTLVALIFIPHWTASVIVLPCIFVLYVDLLGFMQWMGVHINAVSYVCLAMSIGLLVDYVMHVLFGYYESKGNRREKTTSMLKTMGASILLGGTTTFLGTIPLMFSTSDIFEIVFVIFLGIVTLGMSHGLILLPIILDTFGPEDQVSLAHVGNKKEPGTLL